MLKDTIAVYSFHPPGIIPLIKGNESRIDSPGERWLWDETPWNEPGSPWLISVLMQIGNDVNFASMYITFPATNNW